MEHQSKGILTFDEFSKLSLDYLSIGEDSIYLRSISKEFPHHILLSNDINGAFYVKKGSLSVRINDREMIVRKGDLLILSPNDYLEYIVPDELYQGNSIIISTNLMLELTGEVELYRFMVYLKENPIIKIPTDNEEIITTYLRLIDHKIEKSRNFKRDTIAINYLLHGLVIEVFEVLRLIDESTYMHRHNIFKRFMEMINTLNTHNHPVEWYASRLNVTAKYLSEVCRKSSGRPASAWIKEYCILDIKRYLRDEDKSIKEISFILGYPNLSFFGKCIRRWFGMSPTALRLKLKQ